MNKTQLIGNITQDPELRENKDGSKVCSFSVATNESYKDKNGKKQTRSEFHNCIAWNKLGETIEKYVRKGNKIYVEGKLATRCWDDPAGGGKRYKTEIIVKEVEFLTPKPKKGEVVSPETPASHPSDTYTPGDEISIDDIPF